MNITVTVVPPAVVAHLTIDNVSTGKPLVLEVGTNLQLEVHLFDRDRVPVRDRNVSWAASKAEVVTVTREGLLEAHRVGDATVTARCDDAEVGFDITVKPAPRCASIRFVSAVSRLTVGQTHHLDVALYDAGNRTLHTRPMTWESSNTAVARIGQDGLVQAMSAGSARIVVTCEDATAHNDLTVVARPTIASTEILGAPTSVMATGTYVQLSARVRLTDGTRMADRGCVWRSDDSAVASVDASGRVAARTEGDTTIHASCDGKADHVVIRVRAVSYRVSIVTKYEQMAVGYQVQLGIRVTDRVGNTLPARSVHWSVSDRSVATVDSSGMFRTHGAGRVVVTAECDGVTGTHTMTVVPPPPPMVHVLTFPLMMTSYTLNRDGSFHAVQSPMGQQTNPPNITATTTPSNDQRFIWRVQVDGAIFGMPITEVLYVQRNGTVHAQGQDLFGNQTLNEVGSATFWN